MDDPANPVPSMISSSQSTRARRGLAWLTLVQVATVSVALVTSPIMARALGPHGRGLVAAVMVPIGLLPYIGQLGIGAFVVNSAARGIPPRLLVGSLGLPLLAVGSLIAAASPLLASALAGRHPLVLPYLTIGLALAPIWLLSTLVLDVLWGRQQWGQLVAGRLLTPLFLLVAIVGLGASGQLTVSSACVIVLVSGAVSLIIVVPAVSRFGRPHLDRALTRQGMAFGMKAWPGTLANLGNLRLDQLLMIPLVSPRQLGLYAVAVSISGLGTIFTGQIVTVLLPRFAAGDFSLIAPSVRATILTSVATDVLVAGGTLLLLTTIFGSDFGDARGLVLVLLAAGLPAAAGSTLGQVFGAIGRPEVATFSEVAALVVTIPGLIILLPLLGAVGAALVSLAAYSVAFGVLVVAASRQFDYPLVELMRPRTADVQLIVGAVRRTVRRPAGA
jgi:O-antigen/teichoic acid export membrane protein